jgi:hypothetical protein
VSVIEQVGEMLASKKRWTFTLEAGRGETYADGKPTLYGHSTYERSSVLAGRDQRVFVDSWDNWGEARAAIVDIQNEHGRRFKCEEIGGTTHVPIEQIVSHLPDDTDY